MKKIIYSLVIMIAAGSLFTSCIEQVEPVGLLDMRTAKAEYIRALKDLRAADAEYTRAKAAVEQANARYRDAETAFKNAQVENQKLLNDLQELWNEATAQENVRRAAEIAAEIEGIEMKMEELAAAHAVQMVKYEAQLAQAQEGLRVVLRDIAIAAKSLSPNEKLAVIESAAIVAALSEAQVKALKDVNEAQYYLDSLTFKALVNGSTWEDGYLEDLEEHYEDLIEEEQAKIVILEAAKALVPLATAQISEWQDIVDGYAKDSIAIAQEMAQQTYDSTAYINATVKPGIVKFNKAIAEFIEENWETPDKDVTTYKYAEPALTAAEEKAYNKGVAPKQADYMKGGRKDTLKASDFTKLVMPGKNAWFYKFAYMLESYHQEIPWDNGNYFGIIAASVNTNPDTIMIGGKVLWDMSDFIVGDEDGDGFETRKYEYIDENEVKQTLTANYGLWGAYEILNRIYKAEGNAIEDSADFFKEKARLADSAWVSQHDTLLQGLSKFAAYKTAMDNFTQKKNAYTTALEADALLAKAVADKAKALRDQMQLVVGDTVVLHAPLNATGTYFNSNDTAAIFNALVAYAAARDAYLTQATIVDHDSTKFYFWKGYDQQAGKQMVDSSTVFSALSEATLREALGKNYDCDWKKNVETKAAAIFNQSFYIDWTSHTDDVSVPFYNNGIANIANQLLGSNFATWFQGRTRLNGTVPSYSLPITYNETDLNKARVIQDTTGFGEQLNAGLWGGFAIDIVGGKVTKNGEPYTGKAVEDALKALNEAETAVVAAINKYIGTYNAYWGQSAAELIVSDYFENHAKKEGADETVGDRFNDTLMVKATAKLKEGSYNISIFRPHEGDKTPVAMFSPVGTAWAEGFPVSSSKLDANSDIVTILKAIDPRQKVTVTDVTPSVIFYGNDKKTTAYEALYWNYMYWLSQNQPELVDALETIEEWIEDVEDTFATNAAAEPEPDVTAYKAAVKAFNDAVARKEVVDAYMVKKLAFVGTRTEQIGGKDSVVLNSLFITNTPIDTIEADVTYKLNTTADPFAFLFATNLFGEYVGWTKKLDGQQLANAKEFFGEEPYEQIQDWKVARKVNEAKQATLSDLKQKAEAVFVEKAKVEGLADPDSTSLASIEAQWKGYVAKIDEGIAEAKKKINGDPDVEGDKGYAGKLADAIAGNIDAEYLIKDAQIELAAAEARLADITKMLEKAQANLDKIMEYIRSTDAEFVIPVTIEEIDALIASVKKNLPTTASSIAALIAAYMGVGVEDAEDVEGGE